MSSSSFFSLLTLFACLVAVHSPFFPCTNTFFVAATMDMENTQYLSSDGKVINIPHRGGMAPPNFDFSKLNIPGAVTETITFDPSEVYYDFDSDPNPSGLSKLTNQNFSSFIKENGKVLVYFYAAWCEPCKLMYPKFKSAAILSRRLKNNCKMAVVDGVVEEQLMDRYRLQGYPMLLFFENGDETLWVTYNEARSFNVLMNWINRREQPLVVDLTDTKVEEYMDGHFKRSGNVLIVAYVIEGSKKELFFRAFAQEAFDMLQWQFAIVYVEAKNEICIEIRKYPQRFSLTDDSKIIKYTGDAKRNWDEESLSQEIKSTHQRIIQQDIDPNIHVHQGSNLGVLMIGENNDYQPIVDLIEPIAKDYAGMIKFAFVSPDEHMDFVISLGITSIDKSLTLIEFSGDAEYSPSSRESKKFRYSGNFKEKSVRKFLKSWEAGKLKSYKNSVDSFPKNVTMKHLSASTFESIALDPEKHVFVLYYTRRCEACQEAFIPWVDLHYAVEKSAKLKDSVVIALLNGVENDMADQGIAHFPSFVLYPAGANSLERRRTYTGSSNVDSFFAFLEDAYEDVLEYDEL
ncbi:thioredoxin domain-containing protein [Cardiosporidium cionae]|uniref:Thioredoxin domain-containing protein n=1 Tax=Cardiosporidium cionae TaxID=476202 RepID=A0ABQ7JF00_9APIC|nr:thioredoxin domain-containing protein [Cardiosporidium cionae]|eukprot:KAF8822582.1 thioredoxin domain-containing protein [Cardiosporidium cionae]